VLTPRLLHGTTFQQLPREVRWHFVGHLQSNKCKQLLSVENLWMVETIDSANLAKKLGLAATSCNRPEPLRVMIQINASEEECESLIPDP